MINACNFVTQHGLFDIKDNIWMKIMWSHADNVIAVLNDGEKKKAKKSETKKLSLKKLTTSLLGLNIVLLILYISFELNVVNSYANQVPKCFEIDFSSFSSFSSLSERLDWECCVKIWDRRPQVFQMIDSMEHNHEIKLPVESSWNDGWNGIKLLAIVKTMNNNE